MRWSSHFRGKQDLWCLADDGSELPNCYAFRLYAARMVALTGMLVLQLHWHAFACLERMCSEAPSCCAAPRVQMKLRNSTVAGH